MISPDSNNNNQEKETSFESLIQLGLNHVENIIKTNTISFEKDPYVNYMFYEVDIKEKSKFNEYLQSAFVNQTIHFNSSYALDTDLSSLALLLPYHCPWPEDLWTVFTDDQKVRLLDERKLQDTFDRFVKLEEFISDKFAEYDAIEGYYLLILSTDHRFRNKGLASKLLKALFTKFDKEQKKCYLECTSIYMVPFYQKHGFKILGQDKLPKVGNVPDQDIPVITFLSRDPLP